MKTYAFITLASLLLWAGCKKEDFTRNYPGTYAVSGTRQVFGQDSIVIQTITDTIILSKVDNNTLSFSGIELTYNAVDTYRGKMFDRMESSTYYKVAFDDIYPDSLYFYSSHADAFSGGYSMHLRGGRISP